MNKKYLYPISFALLFALVSCNQPVVVPEEVNFVISELATTDFHTDFQNEFLTSEDPDSWCNQKWIYLTTYSNSAPNALSFSWQSTNDKEAKPSKYVVSISENSDMSDALTYNSSKESVDIYNLKINTQYYWTVTAYFGSKGFASDVASFTTTSNGPRNIYVDGVENIRDIGGYPTESGKTFKQGMIYRTAQFNYKRSDEDAIKSAPTAKGKRTLLKELKIKSEIDVRQRDNKGKDETCGIRTSPLGSSVKYQYMPMKFGGSNIFEEEVNKESIKAFFEYLADESNYPVAFHCVRGTDRTGALAYALGALCGVSYQYLLRDYLFSNFAYIDGAVLRENNIGGQSFYVYGIDHSDGETMSERAANYLKENIGVSQETLNSIKNILLK